MTDTSSLSINRKECPKCGAVWLNGVHFWSTGSKGNDLDLAGLVCNTIQSDLCINEMKGSEGGDTWAKRRALMDKLGDEIKRTHDFDGARIDRLD